MRYTLNIALNGNHYCGIKLPAYLRVEDAKNHAMEISARFPESEGFGVTMIAWQEIGEEVLFNVPKGWSVAG